MDSSSEFNLEQRHDLLGAIADQGYELANIVERLTILHSGADIGAGEVRALLQAGPAAPSNRSAEADDESLPLADRLDLYERRIIQTALDQADGNMAEAARLLHTDRANLYRRMRRLGIDR